MDWHVIWAYRGSLADGLWLTVQLSLLAIVGSTVIGIVVGCAAFLPSFALRRLARIYVEVLRNVPVVVKLFFMYFIVGLDAYPAGLIALVLHQSAYIADVVAAGLRAVPQGQMEAAQSCGHSYYQSFGYVLLPQAMRYVIPPLTTQYVQIVKNSSVVMFIALQDLTFVSQEIGQETYRAFESATASTAIYFVLALVIAGAMAAIQRSLDKRKPV